ncbi:hypothetical protein NA56DRAFT_27474 [Hyaloscypha hepaticicola]|uniref:Uncharacterized protein n=1 Tax=Hyaloscypha hepaticicola TaxID=2082293 RepID=A0A2J6QCW5_9HELO|nr:hypothetical protein NA56DRAFT_27474 [Hyaloscypha hepaticicola]
MLSEARLLWPHRLPLFLPSLETCGAINIDCWTPPLKPAKCQLADSLTGLSYSSAVRYGKTTIWCIYNFSSILPVPDGCRQQPAHTLSSLASLPRWSRCLDLSVLSRF